MNIRFATTKDVSTILKLIQELAVYENEPEAVEISATQLLEDGFGEHPNFETLLAEIDVDNEKLVIGMALFYPRYSTWKGKTLHLEDLIVSKSFRHQGAGNALFNELIKIAHSRKVKRVEWNVLSWNTPAINFYNQKGATVFDDWRVCQMNEEAIRQHINLMMK